MVLSLVPSGSCLETPVPMSHNISPAAKGQHSPGLKAQAALMSCGSPALPPTVVSWPGPLQEPKRRGGHETRLPGQKSKMQSEKLVYMDRQSGKKPGTCEQSRCLLLVLHSVFKSGAELGYRL